MKIPGGLSGKLVERFSGNSRRISRGTRGGFPEEVLDDFPNNFEQRDSWETAGGIPEELLEGFAKNSWCDSWGSPGEIPSNLPEEFSRNCRRNS